MAVADGHGDETSVQTNSDFGFERKTGYLKSLIFHSNYPPLVLYRRKYVSQSWKKIFSRERRCEVTNFGGRILWDVPKAGDFATVNFGFPFSCSITLVYSEIRLTFVKKLYFLSESATRKSSLKAHILLSLPYMLTWLRSVCFTTTHLEWVKIIYLINWIVVVSVKSFGSFQMEPSDSFGHGNEGWGLNR